MADAKRTKRRKGRIVAGTAIGVAVCLAGGGVAWANLRPHPVTYRLATVEKADVAQTADLAGTVASASRSDRAFQVAGLARLPLQLPLVRGAWRAARA